MIRCYCDPVTVEPGGILRVAVSTDAPRFVLRIFRQAAELRAVEEIPVYNGEGRRFGDGRCDEDWGWLTHDLQLPPSLDGGAYIVVAGEVSEDGRETWPSLTNTAGEWGKALFVVSPAAGDEASIAYKLSWFTFVCYNATGGGSLYAGARWSDDRSGPGYRVTWRRPGVGAGGLIAEGDPVDVYAPTSRRQTFEHWDVPFIQWLYRHNYRVDFLTDLTIHRNPDVLDRYNLLLSVGHDEYWSDRLRGAIDGFISRGGNVAFLSGNTCCFRVSVDDVAGTLSCMKMRGHEQEYLWQARDPEEATTGVTYWNAGGWWDEEREAIGYDLYHQSHWIFNDVNCATPLGGDSTPPVIGYECDGADYRLRDNRPIVTQVIAGRPATILGLGRLGEGWHAHKAAAAATVLTYTDQSGGIVFTAGTTDWPLAVPTDERLSQVTKNVLDHLMNPSLRILGPFRDGCKAGYVAEGHRYEFQVASASTLTGDAASCLWRVAIDDDATLVSSEEGWRVEVSVPTGATVLTVSAELRTQAGGPAIGFGSRTFDVLTQQVGAAEDFKGALRRAATPGGPPGNLSDPPITRGEYPDYPGRELSFPLSNTQQGIIGNALREMNEARDRATQPEDS